MTTRRIAASDDEDEELGLLRKNTKMHGTANYDLLRLRDMERFIFKFYWMVIILFFGIGVVMVTVLSERSFEEIFMAESLLGSVGVPGQLGGVVLKSGEVHTPFESIQPEHILL